MTAGRIQTCVALALVTAALAPATAQPFSLSHFRVAPAGGIELTEVRWEVTVCGARGHRLAFRAVLVYKGSSRNHGIIRRLNGVQRRNCFRWKLWTEDNLIFGLWESQMTVYSRREARRTAWTVFDNGEEPCQQPCNASLVRTG